MPQAETAQQEACARFEQISETARDDLKTLRVRRVASFQKSLTELAELEVGSFCNEGKPFCPNTCFISGQTLKGSRSDVALGDRRAKDRIVKSWE